MGCNVSRNGSKSEEVMQSYSDQKGSFGSLAQEYDPRSYPTADTKLNSKGRHLDSTGTGQTINNDGPVGATAAAQTRSRLQFDNMDELLNTNLQASHQANLRGSGIGNLPNGPTGN